MALIVWQTKAKRHLRQIFDYYRDNASLTVAVSMRDTIIDSLDCLEQFPTIGLRDDELSTPDTQYFYIIAKKNKRTYRVYYIYENGVCFILAIWDCSMNPAKRKSRVVQRRRR
jgi:plasmid stabilization system protein ParE